MCARTCVSVCVVLSAISHMLQSISYNRSTVSELKEELRRLILRERQPTPLLSAHTSGKSVLFSGTRSRTHTQTNSMMELSVSFCWTQEHRHSHPLTATPEWSELKRQTLTQKTLVQPRAWPRSAQMICPGWKTKTPVRTNVF